MLGVFLAALDQMIVTVAIRTIGDDLHGLDLQAWVTTAYLITSTVSTPLYGKLSDTYGRKPLFILAIVVFIAGSVACAFATSMYMLAAFRAVQGLGAGGLMSLALAIIGDIVPPRQRAKYQAYFLAVFGISSVAGPVLGGFLAGQNHILHTTGWRWVFLVNVPVAAVALLVVAKALNVPHPRRPHRVDWWGGLTIAVCLVPLLIVAEQGRAWGWVSAKSLVCYGIGAGGLLLFLIAEAVMADDALIPLRLFRSGIFSITSLAGVIIGMGMFGGMAVIPLYLQIVKGASPTEAGLLILPIVVGISAGSVFSGQSIARTGRYKIFPVVGTVLMAAGLLLLNTVNVDTPLWRTDIWMLVFGLGLGSCMQPLIIAVQNAVPAKDMGVASSSATFFRQLGATAGTAVFLSILFGAIGSNIAGEFGKLASTPAFRAASRDPKVLADPDNAAVLALIRPHHGPVGGDVLQDSSFLRHLDPRLARPYLVGFADSMHPVFLSAAAALGVAFVLLLLLKEIPLRTQSGLQARAAEAGGPAADAARIEDSAAGSSPDTADLLRELDDPFAAAPEGGVRLHGQVRHTDGGGIVDAALTLIDPVGRQIARTVSLPEGRYQLAAPGAGAYVLITSAAGHQPQATPVIVDGATLAVDVVLTGTSGLVGCVSTAAGAAVRGATAALADARGEVVGATVTGADGRYRFGELVRGCYTLVVSAEHYRPVASSVAVPSGRECVQNVELTGAARLSGKARAGDGRPVRDARITLLDAAGGVIGVTTTDDTGEYAFAELPEGDYRVIAAGYPRVVSTLRVNGGAAAHCDVVLGHPEL
jgi:EmrB/QacA subfamily drug resistance transporter